MEYWNHIDGISLETKLNYQSCFVKADTQWERKGRTWTFYGWQSQLETLQFLEQTARQRRSLCQVEPILNKPTTKH